MVGKSYKRRSEQHGHHGPSSTLWKSIGDGLHDDIDTAESDVASCVSGRVSVSSYRSEVIHRRRSRNSREHDIYRTNSTSRSDSSKKKSQERIYSRITRDISEAGPRNDSDLRVRSKYSSNDMKYSSPISKSRLFATKEEATGNSSSCSEIRGSSSSGDSPCNSTRKFGDISSDSPIEELSPIADNDRSQSVTPTNSPSKQSSNHTDTRNGSFFAMDSYNEHSEMSGQRHGYPYSHHKTTAYIQPTTRKPQTLSSIHNQKNYLSREMGGLYNIPTSARYIKENHEIYSSRDRFPNISTAKENYPAVNKNYSANQSSHQPDFPSLRRHGGHHPHGAPATPQTIRSNSSMKLTSSMDASEDWC